MTAENPGLSSVQVYANVQFYAMSCGIVTASLFSKNLYPLRAFSEFYMLKNAFSNPAIGELTALPRQP